MNKVSVIIPNWNGRELLKICLPSLVKQTLKNFEVIIVDNGSTDSSVDFIENNFPLFKVIRLPQNLGFATAVNKGIKKAQGEYIFLLNNDTELHSRCIDYLVEAAENHLDTGFVSAKMLNFYKRNIIDNAGDDIDVVGHLITKGVGEKDSIKFNKPGYIFLTSGGGSLFKREVFKRVGFFDEDFFFYMEDADFCLRAQLQGFKGWFEPKAKIYHMRMATSSLNLPLMEYLTFRNLMMTVLKNYPPRLVLTNLNWLKFLFVILNTIRYLTFKGQAMAAFRAPIYILINLSRILKKRKKIQSLKKVTDEYIISHILDKKFKLFD